MASSRCGWRSRRQRTWSTPPRYQTDPPWVIGYSDASLTNSARVFINQFALWAASEYPEIEEVARTDANDSPEKQVSDIEDLLVRGVDCLIVAATSEEAIDPAIEQAMAEGVPVVIQERDVTTDDFVSHINIRPDDLGRIQAEGAAEMLGGEGQVVLLEGVPGPLPSCSRRAHEEVLAEHPGIEILATEYTGYSRDEGKTIMENWLQAYDQIDAVIADSGIQQQGAYEAVAEAGRLDEVQVWTGDGLQAWIRQVDSEGIPGVIVNRPLTFGALAIDACAANPLRDAAAPDLVRPGGGARHRQPRPVHRRRRPRFGRVVELVGPSRGVDTRVVDLSTPPVQTRRLAHSSVPGDGSPRPLNW